MRKKTIKFGLDSIFWYIIYLLPIILTVIQSIHVFENFTFENWEYIAGNADLNDYGMMHLLMRNLEVLGFGFAPDEYSAIIELFAELGWTHSYYGPALMFYLWYFIFCNIIHLMIDFILFIPRLAHKWMNAFTKTED